MVPLRNAMLQYHVISDTDFEIAWNFEIRF
jgi:hypothetical protein